MTYIRTKHGFFCGRLTLPLGVTLIFFSEIFLCGGIHVVAQSDESSTDVASDSPSVSVAKNVGELQWPRFLGANYDGAALVGDQSIDWSVEPSFQWNIEVGDGYGIASVNGGRVYQSDAVGGSRFTAGDERLRCLDLSSGKVLWEKQEPIEYQDMYGYEAGPRSSPIIHQGRVITYGVTGLLMCRDALTGSTLWKNEVSQTYGVVQNFFGVGAAPMVAGDLVVVMVGGSPPEDQDLPPGQLDRVIPNGTALVAFDLNNGKEKWKVGDDLASYSSPRFMKIGGKDSVIAFCRGGLLAVELETGRQLWKYAHRASILESVNAMMPIVNNDQIFISECYQLGSVLLQVDPLSANVIWKDDRRSRDKSMRSHWSTPVLVNDYLYGCSGRNAPDSDFRCVKFSTGEVQWVDPRRTRSSVTRWGDHLLVIEERGLLEVMRVNHEKMEVIASYDLSLPSGSRPALRFPCWSAPVVVGDQMLIRGDRNVMCLRWSKR